MKPCAHVAFEVPGTGYPIPPREQRRLRQQYRHRAQRTETQLTLFPVEALDPQPKVTILEECLLCEKIRYVNLDASGRPVHQYIWMHSRLLIS